MAYLLDSYPTSNYSDATTDVATAKAQSFAVGSVGGELESVKWHLVKNGSPTGNVYAKIYAHSGTYGTSSVPTGAALATSDALNVATVPTDITLTTFSFSGANRINLSGSTYYCVSIEYATANGLYMGIDVTSPSHAGNFSDYNEVTHVWQGAAYDAIFYVYLDSGGTTTTTTSTSTSSTSSSSSTSQSTSSTSSSTSRSTSTSSSTSSTSTSSTSSSTSTSASSSTSISTSSTSQSTSTSTTGSTSTSTTYIDFRTIPMIKRVNKERIAFRLRKDI